MGGNTGAWDKLTNTNIVTTGWLRDCLEAAAHVSLPFAVRFVWDDRGKRCADTTTRCGSEVFELSCDPCECKVNVLETFLVGFSIKSTSTQKSTTAYVDAPPQTQHSNGSRKRGTHDEHPMNVQHVNRSDEYSSRR